MNGLQNYMIMDKVRELDVVDSNYNDVILTRIYLINLINIHFSIWRIKVIKYFYHYHQIYYKYTIETNDSKNIKTSNYIINNSNLSVKR